MSEVEGSGKRGRIFNAKRWGGGIIILNRSASHGDGMAQSKTRVYIFTLNTTRSTFSLRVFTCLLAGCFPSLFPINYFEDISIFACIFFDILN